MIFICTIVVLAVIQKSQLQDENEKPSFISSISNIMLIYLKEKLTQQET